MTEKQYIEVKALGTITAAINTLRDLVPANLTHIIKESEAKKTIGTLMEWQDRLFEVLQINQDEEE